MADTSTTGMLLTAIGSLAAVITYLTKTIFDYHKSVQEKLADCERDRDRLWEALADQKGNGETGKDLKDRYSAKD